ncbi:unnamed protein product, partial [Clonostachys solani]
MLDLHSIEQRVYTLACELLFKPATFANTHEDQWCERTLDGSVVRSRFQWF